MKQMMGGWLCMLLSLHLISGSASAQSLEHVVQLALENNTAVKAQQADLEKAQWQAKSAFRKTLPTIDLEASYRHVTEVGQLRFPSILGRPARLINLGAYDTYETSLMAHYPLFTGFASSAGVEMKQTEESISRQELTKTHKEIAFQTITQYRHIQMMQLELAALRSARERVGLQAQRLGSMVSQGMALAADTLSLALAELTYDQKILQVESAMETAGQQLRYLVGTDIRVQSEIPVLHKPQMEELQTDRVVEMKILALQEDRLRRAKEIQDAEFYPRIMLQAGMKYGKPGMDFIKNDWMLYGVWGVGMQWNLWSWQGDRAASQARKAAIREMNFHRKNLEDHLHTRYDNALREYQSLKKQLKVTETALRLAREKMEIFDSRYREGMVSTTEFNEANLELTEAEINNKKQKLVLALKLNEIEYISSKPISEWSIRQ